MEFQTLIVGLIILAACLYAGKILLVKIRSFSPKASCGAGCGCDSQAKPRTLSAQIKRS